MPPEPTDVHALFQPDYTPEQLENLGVYDSLYRGVGPRLASLGEWKPEWVSEHDPKGWAQWYKRYAGGRRLPEEDERQIRRWTSFKARHGGPFAKNPTPRRGWALRNWGIDPSKLVGPDQSAKVQEMLDIYKTKATQKHIAAQQKQADLLPEVQLQEHQQRITDRVTGENPRMLVYHGLGSGKSLSALAAAEAAKKLYGDDYGIVVPASLRGNFQKEVKKFTRNSNPEIMSYTGLGMGKQFKEPPETLIMDEAARLRNPGSAMTQAAMRAARDAKRVMLLTGTPITNAPSDLAPLVSMLQGKSLAPEEFSDRYVGYEKVNPGWWAWLRGIKPGMRPYVKNEKELRELLKGKVDYQPSKTPEGVNVNEEIVRVPLSKEQQKIQHAIRTKIPPGFLWKLDQEFPLSKDELSRLNGFLTGLRQVGLSTQPFRADKDPLKAFDQSAKLTTAMKNLQSVLASDPRKKAIIYSNFVDAGINPYAAGLERAKVPYGIFHGGISAKQRQQALNDFNAGKLRALLLGPAAAEGISTKGTSLIQLLDPHWNEARLQQAKGRGLRFDSHAGLPDELRNVAVQRYLNQSEEPGFFARNIFGKKRERTADEVLERLTAEKEEFNEKFRNLLREIGTEKQTEKSGAYKFAVGFNLPKFSAPSLPKMPNMQRFFGRTQQPAATPAPSVPAPALTHTPKTLPAENPNQLTPTQKELYPTKIVGKPVKPLLPGRWSEFHGNPGAQAWVERNYADPEHSQVIPPSRQQAHDAIWNTVQSVPGAQERYQNETQRMFEASAQRMRRDTPIYEHPRLPLAGSMTMFQQPDPDLMTPDQRAMGLIFGKNLFEPGVHLGTFDKHIGQPGVGSSLYRGLGLSRKLPNMPSMNKYVTGIHELEHAKQDMAFPLQQTMEPPAVMAEVVSAADAARRAARQNVKGRFPLTPNYQPDIEWMRQQAQQHGYEGLGGENTMTELLNTPEGQAWLRMQYGEISPDAGK